MVYILGAIGDVDTAKNARVLCNSGFFLAGQRRQLCILNNLNLLQKMDSNQGLFLVTAA
jgi:hypothetical protein